MLEIAQPEAAEGLLDRDAVQAQLAHLRPELAGKAFSASIRAAIGAILSAAKRAVVSRMASAVSPRPNSRLGP